MLKIRRSLRWESPDLGTIVFILRRGRTSVNISQMTCKANCCFGKHIHHTLETTSRGPFHWLVVYHDSNLTESLFLAFDYWLSDGPKSLHMWQYGCHIMTDILWQLLFWSLEESEKIMMNYPNPRYIFPGGCSLKASQIPKFLHIATRVWGQHWHTWTWKQWGYVSKQQ